MTRPRKQHRYRWGRIGLVVVVLPAIALGIASGVKALMAEPEYVDKVVVVDEDETLWDICSNGRPAELYFPIKFRLHCTAKGGIRQ